MFACITHRWTPGIGDPTLLGWATVIMYVVAGIAAVVRARRAWAGGGSDMPLFWTALSVLLLAMAANKQLDLQSALTAAGRCLAQAQGWYGARRLIQAEFFIAVVTIGVSLYGVAAWKLRRRWSAYWLVLSGLFVLVGFVLLRAASFHHMDAFIHSRMLGVKMNWIFEIGALAMIIAGATQKIKPETIAARPQGTK